VGRWKRSRARAASLSTRQLEFPAAITISSAGEHRQRVRDRQQWIGVADAALRVNPPSFEMLDEGGDPILGSAASGVFV
jgi:hypothetical protein